MKKPKRLKKLKLKRAVQRPIEAASDKITGKGNKSTEQKVEEALQNVPRITNETLSEHREEVLSSARKQIIPLQHSKKSIVRISLGIFGLLIVGFFVLCALELYKFQNTGGFMYDVTRIVPFPVAKVGSNWVSYENYLFELRRNLHYYETQQGSDFSSEGGKLQLNRLKAQAMNSVIQTAYVKKLAAQHGVSVSAQEVDEQVKLVRDQNRLGSNNRVFKDVLSEFWGWSEADFRLELKQQLLTQKVVAKLDTASQAQAQDALKQINKPGASFGKVAMKVSEDQSTKSDGGRYPRPITLNDKELSPLIAAELFKLKKGQTSGIIDAGYTLEIVKVLDVKGGKVTAAHIQFNLDDINTYIKPLAEHNAVHKYIKV